MRPIKGARGTIIIITEMVIKSARKTKIIATLGPASSSAAMIEQLMEAGVDLFRLNFSHGANEEKRRIIETVRQLAKRRDKAIGILADLQGPKIRTGLMENGALPLAKENCSTSPPMRSSGVPA